MEPVRLTNDVGLWVAYTNREDGGAFSEDELIGAGVRTVRKCPMKPCIMVPTDEAARQEFYDMEWTLMSSPNYPNDRRYNDAHYIRAFRTACYWHDRVKRLAQLVLDAQCSGDVRRLAEQHLK